MESLLDPKNDRQIKTLKLPPARPLTSELIWDQPKNLSPLKRSAKLENNKRPFKARRINEKRRCRQNHQNFN